MIYIVILIFIFNIIEVIVKSNSKNKNNSLNSSIKKYQSFTDKNENLEIKKDLKEESITKLKKEKTQVNEKLNLIKADKNITKENCLTNFDIDKKVKANKTSKIIDIRSMENAISHDDDSIYSNMIICNHEKLAVKNNIYNANSDVKKELILEVNDELLKKYVLMKEILDTPLSLK